MNDQNSLESENSNETASQSVSPCLTGEIVKHHTDDTLTDRQRLALELILTGKPDTHVAKVVGVSRRTICRWRHTDADFMTELRRRRKTRWEATADRIRELLDPAVEVLAQQLNDHLDRTRFKAAVTLLRLANIKQAVAIADKEER